MTRGYTNQPYRTSRCPGLHPTLRAPNIANQILSLEAPYAPDASTSLFAQVFLALYPRKK